VARPNSAIQTAWFFGHWRQFDRCERDELDPWHRMIKILRNSPTLCVKSGEGSALVLRSLRLVCSRRFPASGFRMLKHLGRGSLFVRCEENKIESKSNELLPYIVVLSVEARCVSCCVLRVVTAAIPYFRRVFCGSRFSPASLQV